MFLKFGSNKTVFRMHSLRSAFLLLGAIASACFCSLVWANDHWSLQSLRKDGIPEMKDSWISNPIDAFILARLQKEGLTPSSAAPARTFVRRMFLVMHGLPPSAEEIDRWQSRPFSSDLVDYVLQSPRYGERWAQHWLDVIRWAETVGFETNGPRPNAWPYRDWVIASMNHDKPYDQFIFEQIAGDTVGEDAALGFLVSGPANLPGQVGRDEEAMRQARQDELDEVLRNVGQALFGMTIGCARCHDHKFDPVTTHDYYGMQAVFAGLKYGDRRLRGEENDRWAKKVPKIALQVGDLKVELDSMRRDLKLRPPLENVQTEEFEPVVVNAVRMKISGTASGAEASLYEFEVWTTGTDDDASMNVALTEKGGHASASGFALENQTRHPENLNDGTADPRQAFPWKADRRGAAWVQIDLAKTARIDRIVWKRGYSAPVDYEIQVREPGETWKTVAHTRNRHLRRDDRRKASDVHLAGVTRERVNKLVALNSKLRSAKREHARLASGPQVFAANFADPEPTWLLNRGDAMQRGERITPAIPVAFGDLDLASNFNEPDYRVALARHLANPNHPLTARVIVNRVWQHHFGTGLVETPSDFGVMGAEPTHWELLDWLATQLIEDGWSIKKLHRRILTSNTFRQANSPSEKALSIDANTRLLWRFPPRRIEAEAIRDSVLTVSGKLNQKMYGPGFDFFNQKGGLSDYKSLETFNEAGWRRMIYATKIRMQSVDIFGSFDCPDAGQMKPKRLRSTTPIQALSMMNSAFINRQAGFFAERVQSEAGPGLGEHIYHAMKLAFSRSPSVGETQRLKELAESHGLEQVCRVLFNASEFVFIP